MIVTIRRRLDGSFENILISHEFVKKGGNGFIGRIDSSSCRTRHLSTGYNQTRHQKRQYPMAAAGKKYWINFRI